MTRNGRPVWATTVVHRILSDPLYTGTGYANRYYVVPPEESRRRRSPTPQPRCRRQRPPEEWVGIPIPAIIDEPTHRDAVAQLKHNARFSTRRDCNHSYLLRCLLTCGRCGQAMLGVTHPGHGKGPRYYYRCGGRQPLSPTHRPKCTRGMMPLKELEQAVWGHLCQLLEDPVTLVKQFGRLRNETAEREAQWEQEQSKYEARVRRLEREESRLVDSYQAEVITLDELKDRRQDVRKRLQLLRSEWDQQRQLRSQREVAERACEELAAFGDRIPNRLAELDQLEKQKLLQLLVEEVIVGEGTLEIRHVVPLRQLQVEATTSQASPNEFSRESDAEGASLNQSSERLRSDRVPLPHL